MPVESPADLDSFFDTDDFAVTVQITDGEDFDVTINAIFDATTEPVGIYPETNVEAPNPFFRCKTADLAGVRRKMIATIASRAYRIERIEAVDDGEISVVFLSE